MYKTFRRALFIFRRDLRLEDNLALLHALKESEEVILAFIFTEEQIEKNPYRSDHCLQFMIESLEDLEAAILSKKGTLYLFFDEPEKVVSQLIEKVQVDAVFVNRDYTPYSRERDRKIALQCKKRAVPFYSCDDALLHPPEKSLKKDGKPYTVFTPFYKNASSLAIAKPLINRAHHYYTKPISFAIDHAIYKRILPHRVSIARGGRAAGLAILKAVAQFDFYETIRDFPIQEGTTHLSSHLKFNTCSIREIYWAIADRLGATSPLIRSLYWRDFFTSIAFYFPEVFSSAFHPKFDKLEWSEDREQFKRWCEGRTGFPIVDAGMREMNETGFMHNRLRMITASFLVKDLHIDWRWGEKYFAQTLIDYDPAVNNGNWQWAASTGCDAQPYFRIFNPWLQAAKFDPDALYIKRWVPELEGVSAAIIHKWWVEKERPGAPSYPEPMVDHAQEAAKTLAYYKRVASISR